MKYRDKVVVITGGTSGIGKSIAKLMAQEGALVTIVGRNDAKGHAAADELSSLGSVAFKKADVVDFNALSEVVTTVKRTHQRVDFMFNNAGISVIGEARDMQLSDWRHIIEVDLMGVVNGINAVYPTMVEQQSGHIINTSSLAGIFPTPGAVPYVAAKHGVVGLSQALRMEGEPHNVRVSVVCPALVDTPIFGTTRSIRMTVESIRDALPGKPMDADRCARIILRGVERNRAVIAPGLAGFISLVHRYAPFVTTWMGRSVRNKLSGIRQA